MTDAPPVSPETPPTDPPVDPPVETDWKAEAKKWETRSKENAKAAKRLAELEDADKTELQRAVDRAEAAEKRAAEFETAQQITAWKTEISATTGVPAQALRGTTKDELQAHADELKPLLGNRGPIIPTAGQTPTTPPKDERDTVRRLFGSTTS